MPGVEHRKTLGYVSCSYRYTKSDNLSVNKLSDLVLVDENKAKRRYNRRALLN